MCYSLVPIADVVDLLVIERLREGIEEELRLNLAIERYYDDLPHEAEEENSDIVIISDLVSGFSQIPFESVEESFSAPLFERVEYGIHNAPQSYINLQNEVGQFDKINPQYFEDDSYDTVPSYLYFRTLEIVIIKSKVKRWIKADSRLATILVFDPTTNTYYGIHQYNLC